MILQYTALSLVGENRRLAAPASLDGGVSSGLQEDLICHPTPAALKMLAILDNVEAIIAIELLAAAQAADLRSDGLAHAPATETIWRTIRATGPHLCRRPAAGRRCRGDPAAAADHAGCLTTRRIGPWRGSGPMPASPPSPRACPGSASSSVARSWRRASASLWVGPMADLPAAAKAPSASISTAAGSRRASSIATPIWCMAATGRSNSKCGWTEPPTRTSRGPVAASSPR